MTDCHFHAGDEDLGHVHCEACRKEPTIAWDIPPIAATVDEILAPCECYLCSKRERGTLTPEDSWQEYLAHSRERWRQAAKERVKHTKVGGGRKKRAG